MSIETLYALDGHNPPAQRDGEGHIQVAVMFGQDDGPGQVEEHTYREACSGRELADVPGNRPPRRCVWGEWLLSPQVCCSCAFKILCSELVHLIPIQ